MVPALHDVQRQTVEMHTRAAGYRQTLAHVYEYVDPGPFHSLSLWSVDCLLQLAIIV